MSKKMEKRLGLCALAFAAGVLSLMVASGLFAEEMNKYPPANVGVHESLAFYGSKVMVQDDATTSAVRIFNGEGLLDEVCAMNGVAGQYTMVFDYSTTTGITAASYAYALTPLVFTAVGTNGGVDSGCGPGCYCPRNPKKFSLGIVSFQSAASHQTLFSVHSSTGVNPVLVPR